MEVLAIIQARGGSKRLPGKNTKELCGKPLIAWTIEAARDAEEVSRVIVSTDDEEIAEVSSEYGAEVPFLRPAELAADSSKSLGLLEHALTWLSEHESYTPDVVVQLKPVNPLRSAATIDACVRMYDQKIYDSLVSVQPVSEHPYKTWSVSESGEATPFVNESVHGIKEAAKSPKQELPKAYIQNSCVHVIAPQTILEKHSSLGEKVQAYIMESKEGINIDSEEDFEYAAFLLSERSKTS